MGYRACVEGRDISHASSKAESTLSAADGKPTDAGIGVIVAGSMAGVLALLVAAVPVLLPLLPSQIRAMIPVLPGM
ncbi:hypothetical protein [Corynebacterium phocae]|uniref:hypothetical protein n=1 Tax=Corynebacterium phocae TaxID=161895 RepID=UPI000951EC83|nr:hypothetical protein [Corynebacterium phocae]KAA8721736.1 hypothetical protein F4V58_10895 [Corynebacterium phocae]